MTADSMPDDARIGRVALRVSSLDDVVPFYRDAIGLAVRERIDDEVHMAPPGDSPILVLRETPSAEPRSGSAAGLYHVAIRVPSRTDLAHALARLKAAGYAPTGASDHLVSEALYLSDPAGNGLELYRDRPEADWPRTESGGVEMDTLSLDLDDLRRAADGEPPDRMPTGTTIGHIHLDVTDLDATEAFYEDVLGLNVQMRMGTQALFLAAGRYHHHVGANTWRRRTEPADDDARGLAFFTFVLPDEAPLSDLTDRLAANDVPFEEADDGVWTRDQDDNHILLTVD